MFESTANGSYIPKSDPGKRNWMNNFAARVQENRLLYEVSEQDCARLVVLVAKFDDMMRLLNLTENKNKPTVRAKNVARREAVKFCRSLAMRIKANPKVSNAQRTRLRLHVDDEILTRVEVPQSPPTLQVFGTRDCGHEIRFKHNPEHCEDTRSRAKPKGATHLLLFAAICDDGGQAYVQDAKLIGAYTKQPIKVNFPPSSGAAGKRVTYYARWLSGRGGIGPWSQGCSMILAAANGSEHLACAEQLREKPAASATLASTCKSAGS